MKSVTSPDMGMCDMEPGTILRFHSCTPDDQPQRYGWYWYNFEIIGLPIESSI